MEIADEFQQRWQYPHCIGAIDGKHIAIQAPANTGSQYHNYKQFFSIILMAVVDARYRFVMVDVGANGRACDAGVFAASAMSAALENNELSIPPSSPLPGRVNDVPYVIVGDEAFGLKEHLMKPYPARNLGDFERIHNYRLSRARRVSENAFGILGKRFRILDQRMNLSADKCITITNACIVLHNYLLSKHDTQYRENYATRDNNSNVTFANMSQQSSNRSTDSARDIRDEFADYFNTNGQVEWQWDIVPSVV